MTTRSLAPRLPTPDTQDPKSMFLMIRTQGRASFPPSQPPDPDVSGTSLYTRGHPDTSMNPSGTPVVEAETRAMPASPSPAPPTPGTLCQPRSTIQGTPWAGAGEGC